VGEIADEIGGVTSTLAMSSMAASLAGAIAFGSSLNSMWALANQLQMIVLFPFLKIELTEEFLYFIKNFHFTTFNLDFLSNLDIPFISDEIYALDFTQEDEVFKNNGFSSGSYFINFLGVFKSLGIFIV
jgi:hypothetical protein